MDLAYESVGNGPTVLILHGLFASGQCWREVAAELSRHHRVISVDLRNHGASPSADTMGYPEMAVDVLELMAREGLQDAALLGHCVGGKVALAMALLAPDAVRRLCIVEASPLTFLDPWSHQLRGMHRGLPAHGAAEVLRGHGAAGDGTLLNQLALPRCAVRNAYLDWRCDLAAIAPQIPVLRDFPLTLRDRRCPLPVHVVLGAESAFVRPADASAYLPMFPQVGVTVVEGAGHWVHAVRADALLDAATAPA